MAAVSNTDSWYFTHCSYFNKKSKYSLFRPVSNESVQQMPIKETPWNLLTLLNLED